jgi:hypothetical protein
MRRHVCTAQVQGQVRSARLVLGFCNFLQKVHSEEDQGDRTEKHSRGHVAARDAITRLRPRVCQSHVWRHMRVNVPFRGVNSPLLCGKLKLLIYVLEALRVFKC